MRQPPTLKINEIFPSIQGEGLRQGFPTLFIRLSGCNLKCKFCDTKYAWQAGREMTVFQIVDRIKKIHSSFPARWTCITGGEPLLQNIGGLVRSLKAEDFKIQVETNATRFQRIGADWYSISPKPPEYYFRPEYRNKATEVKIVVIKGLDFSLIERLRKNFPIKVPILLQPQSNTKSSGTLAVKLLKEALNEGMPNVRLTAQIHKIFGWR